MDRIEPTFGYDVEGYVFIGRGCGPSGWPRAASLAYRCAKCGDMMAADLSRTFSCRCGAMHLDDGYGRFGSDHGDDNVLVYRKVNA